MKSRTHDWDLGGAKPANSSGYQLMPLVFCAIFFLIVNLSADNLRP